MAEVEIGIGKSGRRAYGFDDIAIVPSRRTRDPEDVDISWEIDAFRFDLPLMAAAITSSSSSIRMRAVAPHTVSSSSSKKCMGRSSRPAMSHRSSR